MLAVHKGAGECCGACGGIEGLREGDADTVAVRSRVSREVGEGFGVVGDHGIEIEGLGVGEVGVGDGSGDGGPGKPVCGEPAAKAVGIVAVVEIGRCVCDREAIDSGFGVALICTQGLQVQTLRPALELVILWTGIRVSALTAPSTPLRMNSRMGVRIPSAKFRGASASVLAQGGTMMQARS